MAHCQSKTPVLSERRRVADSSTLTPCGDPDLHHPLQYRKQEALWKLHCSLKHKEFCACPNFLDHFKWPTGGEGEGLHEGAVGGTAAESTTGENIEGITMGEEEDIPDSELLQ
uniref:ORF2 n=1 Tax=Torque teno Leptonychotes weddellii virus-1 TaxID=2012676 RepID=A0A1Z2RW90_9VIRU|nr:ORF2 [Torque teno Leptonychotes weddellii virus 1]